MLYKAIIANRKGRATFQPCLNPWFIFLTNNSTPRNLERFERHRVSLTHVGCWTGEKNVYPVLRSMGKTSMFKSIINVRVGRFDRHTGQKGVPGSRESSVTKSTELTSN